MKHEPIATANAVAATTVILFVACRVFVSLFPDLMFTIAQSWFHGVALTKFNSPNLSVSSLLIGLVSSTITVWVVGYIFAKAYNYFLKSKQA